MAAISYPREFCPNCALVKGTVGDPNTDLARRIARTSPPPQITLAPLKGSGSRVVIIVTTPDEIPLSSYCYVDLIDGLTCRGTCCQGSINPKEVEVISQRGIISTDFEVRRVE